MPSECHPGYSVSQGDIHESDVNSLCEIFPLVPKEIIEDIYFFSGGSIGVKWSLWVAKGASKVREHFFLFIFCELAFRKMPMRAMWGLGLCDRAVSQQD